MSNDRFVATVRCVECGKEFEITAHTVRYNDVFPCDCGGIAAVIKSEVILNGLFKRKGDN